MKWFLIIILFFYSANSLLHSSHLLKCNLEREIIMNENNREVNLEKISNKILFARVHNDLSIEFLDKNFQTISFDSKSPYHTNLFLISDNEYLYEPYLYLGGKFETILNRKTLILTKIWSDQIFKYDREQSYQCSLNQNLI
jgi:hypothetical protein